MSLDEGSSSSSRSHRGELLIIGDEDLTEGGALQSNFRDFLREKRRKYRYDFCVFPWCLFFSRFSISFFFCLFVLFSPSSSIHSLFLFFVSFCITIYYYTREKLQQMENELDPARRDPDRMRELREKFVDTALSYRGVPYAAKYHPPDCALLDPYFLFRKIFFTLLSPFCLLLSRFRGSGQIMAFSLCHSISAPEANSPIFLDCCGLIRQVEIHSVVASFFFFDLSISSLSLFFSFVFISDRFVKEIACDGREILVSCMHTYACLYVRVDLYDATTLSLHDFLDFSVL